MSFIQILLVISRESLVREWGLKTPWLTIDLLFDFYLNLSHFTYNMLYYIQTAKKHCVWNIEHADVVHRKLSSDSCNSYWAGE